MRIHIATAMAAAVLLSSTAAFAADPVGEVAPAYDWTGFYAGVHGGYGWGESTVSDPAAELFNFFTIGLTGEVAEYDVDGWIGGAQIGAQIQHNQFVLGVEADISASGMSGEETVIDLPNDDFTLDLDTDIEWLATFRARGGVTFDRFLLYVTGGLAVAEVNSGFRASSDGPGIVPAFDESFEDSKTHIGWTAGVGGEAQLTDSLSLKVEYLYVDLGEEHYDLEVLPPLLDIQGNVDITANIVRAGLNYRF
jgi:outer membrane immunogenic protein